MTANVRTDHVLTGVRDGSCILASVFGRARPSCIPQGVFLGILEKVERIGWAVLGAPVMERTGSISPDQQPGIPKLVGEVSSKERSVRGE